MQQTWITLRNILSWKKKQALKVASFMLSVSGLKMAKLMSGDRNQDRDYF